MGRIENILYRTPLQLRPLAAILPLENIEQFFWGKEVWPLGDATVGEFDLIYDVHYKTNDLIRVGSDCCVRRSCRGRDHNYFQLPLYNVS